MQVKSLVLQVLYIYIALLNNIIIYNQIEEIKAINSLLTMTQFLPMCTYDPMLAAQTILSSSIKT